ncbi:MAG: nucleotidyltransferase domain-containing protein [Nanoarchaeota archaeon]|nr:nucleotidyltransferase domain-containing protein [Nanoarchaeota archaeon]MBU4452454.1 nucleotidyltransferase domain-containing protein [Nanoarchaeota archaeon]MCG2723984.1 nucleotidyltransferase domain-containing protein [archaeon]
MPSKDAQKKNSKEPESKKEKQEETSTKKLHERYTLRKNKETKKETTPVEKKSGAPVGNKEETQKEGEHKDEKKESTPEEKERKKEQERRFKVAQDFSRRLIEKFKKTVKCVIVYGSTATGSHKKTSDIDTFVLMDDTKIEQEIPQEVKDRIWNEILRVAKDTNEANKIPEGQGITIQAFMFLTEFWENMRTAEAVLLAILRTGVPVFDVGVFMPAKRMLLRGKIPTTKEAVDKKIAAAPEFVEYARARVKSAAHYLEQGMAAAGQGALMFIGRVPPNKEEVPKALRESFVADGLLEEKYVKDAEDIRKFAKELEHRKEEDCKVCGAEVDKYLNLTDEFVKRMEKLVKDLESKKKSTVLMNTYKTFLKANVGALKYKGVTPPESLKDLPKVMYQHFPDFKDSHAELFEHLTRVLTMVKDGKENEIPERDVYDLREKTKMFVLNLGKKLKDMKERGEIVVPEETELNKEKDSAEGQKQQQPIMTEEMINEKEKKK